MTSLLLIESSGTIKVLKAKDVTLGTLYKKCGFRSCDHFGPRHIWNVSVKGETQPVTVGLWAKVVGKANYENNYNFPNPVHNKLYYGTSTLVRLNGNKILNLTPEVWDKVQNALKAAAAAATESEGGMEEAGETENNEELDEEEEEEEEDDEDTDIIHTKVYLKNGVLVINKKQMRAEGEGEGEDDTDDEDDLEDDVMETDEEEDEAIIEDDGEDGGEGDEEDTERVLTKKKIRGSKMIGNKNVVTKKTTITSSASSRKVKVPVVLVLPVDIEELREEPYDYSDLEME